MAELSDILLLFAAIMAIVYCAIVSRKLSRLAGLDNGLGNAIAILSQQVDELSQTLSQAQNEAERSQHILASSSAEAQEVALRLELLLSSFEDVRDLDGALDTSASDVQTRRRSGLVDAL